MGIALLVVVVLGVVSCDDVCITLIDPFTTNTKRTHPTPRTAGGFINDMVKESFEDEEEAMFLHMDRKPTFTK